MTDNQREINSQKLIRLHRVMTTKDILEAIDLANAIKYSQGYISEILNEKKKVPKTMGQKLEDHLNVSRKWFDTGNGEMLLQNGEENAHDLNISKENNNKIVSESKSIYTPPGNIISQNANRRKSSALIPFYNSDFMAGASEMFYEDATIYPEYFMDVPEFYGCTAFRAYSDSMETKIRSGNILFGIKIEDWRSHLEFGQIYGITCTDGRRYLKYIRRNENDKSAFLLKSENPNYDDFTIPKSKINNIWLIEGWLDKRT